MQTTENQRRIEYRANLQVVRDLELAMMKQLKDGQRLQVEKKESTMPATGQTRKTTVTFDKIDPKGYIKCKKHDFF